MKLIYILGFTFFLISQWGWINRMYKIFFPCRIIQSIGFESQNERINKEYKHFKSNFSLIVRHVGPVWSPWLHIPGGHKTNVVGTMNMLGLAKRVGARFLVTSTSEVYGDPLQHPQVETYWGNVNPIGNFKFFNSNYFMFKIMK